MNTILLSACYTRALIIGTRDNLYLFLVYFCTLDRPCASRICHVINKRIRRHDDDDDDDEVLFARKQLSGEQRSSAETRETLRSQ